MKTTNYRIKQLAERLSLATFTTLAVMGFSALHENLEQSVSELPNAKTTLWRGLLTSRGTASA